MAIFLGLLPLLLRIAGMILDKAGATEEEKRRFLEMAVNAKDDALTPIQRKDELAALKNKLKERMKVAP